MKTPDFRAELERLVDLYEALGGNWSPHGYTDTWNDALAGARTALATPPPEPPTDEERLADFTKWLAREMPRNTIIGDPLWWAPRIWHAALERWGR